MKKLHPLLPVPAVGVRVGAATLLVVALCCLGACAPQGSNTDTQSATQDREPVIEAGWSMAGDCGICHAAERESCENSACEASLHKDVGCAQCHSDEAVLATVHEGKTASDKMPSRLKKTSVDDTLCLSCHYGDRESLIAATDGTAVLTDSEGTSRNPHDPQGVAEHEAVVCSDCHKMHSSEDIQDLAMKECVSCHHEGVFACHTCHE